MRVANAHHDPGPDGLKMFNIGYLAGIGGILFAWNSTILIKLTVSGQYIGFTAFCLKKTLDSTTFNAVVAKTIMVLLCVVFSLIIIRRTKIYLSRLQDSHLSNLPSKNALTYIDTLILFSIVSGFFIIQSICILFWTLDILSFDVGSLVICILSIIFIDIGVGFIFPIYIIIKTKRYLPRLWNDSRQIIGQNNDFFSINPATVAPALGPQSTSQETAESSL